MTSERDIKVGFALGSGASRGWSHIGVIKALQEAGIEPDIVCGASVGAVIGGSYVAGNLGKLEEWVVGSSRTDVLRFFEISFSKSGFVDEKRLNWFLKNYVADDKVRIEDLPKKFAAVSTDLDSGREVWFMEGALTDAVRASMAMPGLFPAVRNDNRWLVDGGLVNPVPVTTCRALGADVVIAVNLNANIVGKRIQSKSQPKSREFDGILGNFKQTALEYSNAIFPNRDDADATPGLFYAIANSINIFQDRITRSRLAGDPADLLLIPDVASIGMLEFHRAAEAIEEGERCVKKSLAEIRRVTGAD